MAEAVDVARRTETVLQGLEVILKIWRLGVHYCRGHGASAPLPHPALYPLKAGKVPSEEEKP